MILAIDIGNTNISIGVFNSDITPAALFKLATTPFRTSDEYALLFSQFMQKHAVKTTDIEGCILSSVVPSLSARLFAAVTDAFGCKIITVSHGIKTGLNIRADHHTELGSDIVANTVAAAARLQKPFAVIDLGTATTVSCVNRAGELFGVMICPGVNLAADALFDICAELPSVSLTAPKKLLGKNTADAIASGCILAPALMLDGIIARLRAELGDDLSLIACGGMAGAVIPHMSEPVEIAEHLTLEGLVRIYLLNRKKR